MRGGTTCGVRCVWLCANCGGEGPVDGPGLVVLHATALNSPVRARGMYPVHLHHRTTIGLCDMYLGDLIIKLGLVFLGSIMAEYSGQTC